MRKPVSKGAAGRTAAGRLPEAGVSSAVRRAFNAALHPRDGRGQFRQSDNPQQRPAPRSRPSEERKPRETAGEKALKTSGVTGDDTIEVLSSRVRKYKGFDTVESFVAAHPKGRAYALRTLAADQKAGRIGFSAASAGAAAGKDVSARAKPPITAEDATDASHVPAKGTPEREFHDDMLRATSVFGERGKLDVIYDDGKPYGFSVRVTGDDGGEAGSISRLFGTEADGTKYVKHNVFILSSENQASGQAKEFLARSVEAYKHLGVGKVKLQANIDVGGYAWLRYGFRPDREGVEDLARHATKRIEELRSAGHISDTMHQHLSRAIRQEDFQSVIDIGGTTKVTYRGQSKSLGKHIFMGSEWSGELDLNDRSAMNQFNSYVGAR